MKLSVINLSTHVREGYSSHFVLFCCSVLQHWISNNGLLVSERSERDTLSRSSMKNTIRIYIYISESAVALSI